jgi:hypothetical protein
MNVWNFDLNGQLRCFKLQQGKLQLQPLEIYTNCGTDSVKYDHYITLLFIYKTPMTPILILQNIKRPP